MEDEREDSSGSEGELRPANAIFFQQYPSRGPIPIYLHASLGKGGKTALAKRITGAGGQITNDEEHANVIICRDDHPAFSGLQHKYSHHRYVHVEPPSWVEHCLRVRRCKHAPAGKITISKRNSGRTRSDFTPEDDKNLARFLALRLPFKKQAGRTGNGVYKDLVSAERASLYPWAKNHPWQSWRERYKKNQEIFDRAIQRMVDMDPDPPKPGEQGQYFVKGAKPKISLKHMVEHESEDDDWEIEEEGEEAEEEEDVDAPALNSHERMSSRAMAPPRKKPRFNSQDSENDIDVVHNEGKGKGRGYSEVGNLLPEKDLEFADDWVQNVPGPSQFDGARVDDQVFAPPSVHSSVRAHRRTSSILPSIPGSPKRRKSSARNRHIYKKPSGTQRTLVGKSGVAENPKTPPPDTQATLVQSSRSRSRQPRADISDVPHSTKYPNTRSRPRPAAEYPAPEVPPDPSVKRPRGRPRKVPRTVPPPSMEVSAQPSGAGSSHVVATAADEARVEALLHSEERDSGELLSSDDQDAQNLLRENRKLLAQPFRAPGIENNYPGHQSTSPPPYIDLTRRGPAASASRQTRIFRPTLNTRDNIPGSAHETDSGSTPKPRIRIRAAKKFAARNTDPSADSQEQQSEDSTDATSFPAEDTGARDFKIARAPFKPSPGTRAEQYSRTSTLKGKEKAG